MIAQVSPFFSLPLPLPLQRFATVVLGVTDYHFLVAVVAAAVVVALVPIHILPRILQDKHR